MLNTDAERCVNVSMFNRLFLRDTQQSDGFLSRHHKRRLDGYSVTTTWSVYEYIVFAYKLQLCLIEIRRQIYFVSVENLS